MATGTQSMKSKGPAPTVDQINADRITQLANRYWAPYTIENHLPFDDRVVEDIYTKEIRGSNFSIRRIMMLEFSQYLENYLWPNYLTSKSSHAHMMSIVIMVNEKFRERVPAWQPFRKLQEHFPGFFQQMLEACLMDEPNCSLREQTALLVFLNHCFNSMEVDLIRDQVKRLVSLSMWVSLQQGRREQELRAVPKWRKYWKLIQRKDTQEAREKLDWERRFLQRLMVKFMKLLESLQPEGEVSSEVVHYCERFLELVIDLEALLPTRRFFNTVLDDCHVVVRCHLSHLPRLPEGNLFAQDLRPSWPCASKTGAHFNMKKVCSKIEPRILTPEKEKTTQMTIYYSGEAQDPRLGTSTLVPCDCFLFPKIKSALKGNRFESVDAVKAKAMEVMKKLSEKDLQHCFQQWKIRLEQCRGWGGGKL
ncbi:hypothetical protein B7P43_G01661 [Cryptotermes secundus]|uniref:RNA helicase aquarius N-terminal domain-containing protein n=1 Tax=Cryptotermes secundus TaxID=105785 RepID=A0A2J7PR16_9NEOP|nr:hypothetical protein B7P43_G01661 [Cryptotermes secundus]